MRTSLLILCLSATAGNANGPMSAAEFDAYTRDKTFYYANQGQPYGAEEYLSDRRVIWSFLDGKCQHGEWYQEGEQICFVYENQSDPQCWSFTKSASGIVAQFENDPDQTELYEMRKSRESLMCLGPETGV